MTSMDVDGGLASATSRAVRRVHFHDPDASPARVVTPSVFVAVREEQGRLLLVRRCDSGAWELPEGRVDVGESAVEAAVREAAEETGLRVRSPGSSGCSPTPRTSWRPRQATRYASSSWCASTDRPSGAGPTPTGTKPAMPPGSTTRTSRR